MDFLIVDFFGLKRVISFDIAAIVMLIILIFSCSARKMTKGRTNKLLLTGIIATIICTVGDVMSVVFPVLGDNLGINFDTATFISSTVYFLGFTIILPVFILFSAAGIGYWHVVKRDKFMKFSLILCVILAVGLLATNIFFPTDLVTPLSAGGKSGFIFYIEPGSGLNGGYCRGGLNWTIYVVYAITFIVFVFFLLRYRKFIQPYQLWSLVALYGANIIALVCQLIFPDYLIQMFAISIALNVLPVTFSRPEMMDASLDINNYNSYINFIRKVFQTNRVIKVIFVSVANNDSIHLSLGNAGYEDFQRKIIDYALKCCDEKKVVCNKFLINNDNFAFVFEDDFVTASLVNIAEKVNEYLNGDVKVNNEVVNVVTNVAYAENDSELLSCEMFINYSNTVAKFLEPNGNVHILGDICNTDEFQIRTNIDAIVDNGIKEGRMEMYYQPIYSYEEEKFISCEALIRLKDERYGYISPALFIPRAEATGDIHIIGDFILDSVFSFVGSDEFRKTGLRYVEVNLSGVQLLEPGFVAKLDSIFKKYKVPKDAINFEITETFNIKSKTTDDNIARMVDAGFHFSLDDYGTGFSNIKRIGTLPVDIVKLDRSFVLKIKNKRIFIVTKNTIQLLKKMNKKIVIEGIETKESLDLFKKFGCDYVQGYYYSKPIPKDDFVKFVIESNGFYYL